MGPESKYIRYHHYHFHIPFPHSISTFHSISTYTTGKKTTTAARSCDPERDRRCYSNEIKVYESNTQNYGNDNCELSQTTSLVTQPNSCTGCKTRRTNFGLELNTDNDYPKTKILNR